MFHKNQYQGILRRTSFYESEQGNAQGGVMLKPNSVMLNPALKNVTLNLFQGLSLLQHLIPFQGLSLFHGLFQHLIHWAKPLMIFCALIIGGLCFGQNGKLKYDSKFAIGLTGGLNYAVYLGDRWPKKTVSALRLNIGVDSRFKVIGKLYGAFELSYLRLYYDTKSDYGTQISEDRITFDNIYVSSGFTMVILRKGLFSPNIGIGLACVWPFTGTWDSYSLSYKNVNNCQAMFFSGIVGLNVDKFPFENTLLNLALKAHHCIAHTSDPYIHHPLVWSKGVAISKSIPLKLTIGLLFKI